jgi:hypothetical protein
MEFSFMVTTYCSQDKHLESLKGCLAAISTHYPNTRTYVLDDHSPRDVSQVLPSNSDLFIVHKTKYKQAGELNPYLFALELELELERFVFIHDTVTVKPGIVELVKHHHDKDIVLLWSTKRYLFTDVFSQPNENILDKFTVGGSPARPLLRGYQRSLNPNFVVAFGGMSLFTRRFAEKFIECSNIQDLAPLFTSRPNRCLFERLLSLVILTIYGDKPIRVLFDDIFAHPAPYYNQDPHAEYIHPVVKTWSGR